MKLKLLAPFAVDDFMLRTARVMQEQEAYEKAWTDVAEHLQNLTSKQRDADFPCRINDLKFTHSKDYSNRVGSRYRAINTHALPRPLHMLELIVNWTPEVLCEQLSRARERCNRNGSPAALDRIEQSLARGITAEAPSAIVRIYDHGVGLFELDLPVPIKELDPEDSKHFCDLLDSLQQLGIALVEEVAQQMYNSLLLPLFRQLHQQKQIQPYVRHSDSVAAALHHSRALWVTRWLIVQKDDAVSKRQDLRRAIARHWLKDVADCGDVLNKCSKQPGAYSMRWLNYFFGEGTYDGAYPVEAENFLTPEGSVRPKVSWPQYEALLIAQYHYAAFDRLQSKVSHILTMSVNDDARHDVTSSKRRLDSVIRDATMLKVEFEENRRRYSRNVAEGVKAILDNWEFDDQLLPQVERRIEQCHKRLKELHSRANERASVYAGLLLLAIGVLAVFEIMLFMSMYGRTISADARMAVYDRTSLLNIVHWVGSSSTDLVLGSAALFSLGLVGLYVFFRMVRSRG